LGFDDTVELLTQRWIAALTELVEAQARCDCRLTGRRQTSKHAVVYARRL
jgi:hypothetical protein